MASDLMIDVFPHIHPPRFFERLGTVVPRYPKSPNIVVRPVLWDLEARFRMMDEFPGYVQVLTLSGPPIEEMTKDAATARDLAAAANDELAELVAKYPDRFLGFGASVSLHDVDSAIRELERAVEMGALGVQLYTNVAGAPLDEPRFEPFFARLAALDRLLWIHPTRTADHADYPTEERSKYGMYMKLGWPYETSVCMSRLIFSGIMDRYPDLRVLTHHAGGIVPHLAGRLVLHLDIPDERKSINVPDKYEPDAALAAYRRFYGDTVFSGAHHPLACALAFFGREQILFGTDMPYGAEGGRLFVRETIAAVEEQAANETERRELFEGNARKLLRL